MKKIRKNEEELPQHLNLAKDTILYGPKKDYGDYYEYVDKASYHFWKIYPYVRRFWDKHIGEDYQSCRTLLIKRIYEKFGYKDYRLESLGLHKITYYSNYIRDMYYIDEDGNIAKNTYSSNRPKYIKIGESAITGYRFNIKATPYEDISKIIKYFGHDFYNKMCDELLEPSLFHYMQSKLNYKKIVYDYVAYGPEEETVKRGSDAYYKYIAEQHDAKNKQTRVYKKEKEEKFKDLLQTIIAEERGRKWAENHEKMLKHGFDDDSFRGEEYHGQKRKKK